MPNDVVLITTTAPCWRCYCCFFYGWSYELCEQWTRQVTSLLYCRQLRVAPPSPLALLAYIVCVYIVAELILAQYVVTEEITSFCELSQQMRQLYNGLQPG